MPLLAAWMALLRVPIKNHINISILNAGSQAQDKGDSGSRDGIPCVHVVLKAPSTASTKRLTSLADSI